MKYECLFQAVPHGIALPGLPTGEITLTYMAAQPARMMVEYPIFMVELVGTDIFHMFPRDFNVNTAVSIQSSQTKLAF